MDKSGVGHKELMAEISEQHDRQVYEAIKGDKSKLVLLIKNDLSKSSSSMSYIQTNKSKFAIYASFGTRVSQIIDLNEARRRFEGLLGNFRAMTYDEFRNELKMSISRSKDGL